MRVHATFFLIYLQKICAIGKNGVSRGSMRGGLSDVGIPTKLFVGSAQNAKISIDRLPEKVYNNYVVFICRNITMAVYAALF